MLSLLLWSVLLSGAPSDAHVTFTMRAAPLEQAVAEIARQSGAKLTVDPPIAKELVILRLKDAPIAEVKKHLAEVVDAEWTASGPNEVLTRTPEIKKRLKEQAFAERVAIWKKAIGDMTFDDQWDRNCALTVEDYAKSDGSTNTPDQFRQRYRKQTAFQNQSPQGRLLARALKLLGAERLAALPTDARVVFSSNPTPMQRSFGRGGEGLYRAFAAEAQTWDAALQNSGDPDNIEVARFRSYFGGRLPEAGFVHVVFEWETPNLSVEPRVYGQNGQLISQLSFRPDTGFGSPTSEMKAMIGFDKPVVESEESVAIRQLMNPGALPIPPLAIEVLTHPESHELLAGGPSDVAIQAAEHKNLNLIAAMPDLAFGVTAAPSAKSLALGMALTMLQDVAKIDLDEKAGWLTIKPSNMGLLGQVVLPRRAIADLVKADLKSGRQTFDSLADYCLKVDGTVSLMYGQMLAGYALGKPASYVSPDGWRVLRLYATLSNPQKAAAARSGLTLPIRQMSRRQRALVEELVYAHEQSFSDEPTTKLNGEPTAVLPNGLPGDGLVTIRLGSTPKLFGTGSYPGAPPSPTTPETAAWQTYLKENNASEGGAPSGFAVCAVDYVSLTLELPPAGVLSTSATLNNVPPNAKWVPFNELPAEYRDAYVRTLEQYRKSNITFGSGSPSRPKQP